MLNLHVENMTSKSGNKIANQFVITDYGRGANGNFIRRETFQSYESIIAEITYWKNETEIILDEYYWDYSKTTGKYRNMFLNETKKETEAKIKSGKYRLAQLN